MTESNTIKLGPAGRNDGSTWDERGRSEIVRIFIWHGDNLGIKCIQFQYSDDNGNLVLSAKYGCRGGFFPLKFDIVQFDHPSEYITSISGSYNNDPSIGIASLKFGTNRGDYGPFGRRQSNGPFGRCQSNVTSAAAKEFHFQLGKNGREFDGFHGTQGNYYVSSIGVYFKPIMLLSSLQKAIPKVKEERMG